ncbi:DUF1963 domain-containing protein [Actinomadura xylanilytica]|uniref:DUF1963 domain-containing protein n=1 Tax=Actinomadura xylanilytica TaxID=887459 RepID=UPI00255B3043|nr:DUF1963 domain-containing protein [Actinomadura xylanilytica]MDL4773860.1 DUF1963 domain-containing protein [Actinomadura xylanilytica]
MDLPTETAAVHRLCTERLGAALGPQLAALARPGFDLTPANDARPATGRCRLGGPALLDPGTPWPRCDDLPLVLFAVLDTDELAPWLGDELPCRPGLLNFFYLDTAPSGYDLDDPAICRVVPANPARAVAVTAPQPERGFAAVPLNARPDLTLPGLISSGSFMSLESLIEDFGFTPDPGIEADRLEADALLMFGDFPEDQYYPGPLGVDQAFGWTAEEATHRLLPDPQGEYTRLLRISSNLAEWEFPEGGGLHFLIPTKALRDGDFTQAVAEPDFP